MPCFSMRRFAPIEFGQAGFRLALMPTALGRVFPWDRAALIVVAIRVIRSTLPIQMPLQLSDVGVVPNDLGCKLSEFRLRFSNDGDRGGADVQRLDFRPVGMTKWSRIRVDFSQRDALAHQLGEPETSAFDRAPHEPNIFNTLGQSIGDDRIFIRPFDHRQDDRSPVQSPLAPSQTCRMGFSVETPDLVETAAALEAHLMRSPQGETIHGTECPSGECLPNNGIHVVANP